jgi:shikimate dehydrogenase
MGTRRACVMGFPVRHSRAPVIHGHWIAEHGLDAELRLEEVRAEDFPAFLASLGERGYVGGSATMPHKLMALELTDADESARAIGAANVIWLEDGRLRSTNSDVAGFVAALDESAPGWQGATECALVIGAGGAARAIVHGLLERGVAQVWVHNRDHAKAEALARRFGPHVAAIEQRHLAGRLGDSRLLVNATSLGMAGQPELEIDLAPLPDDAVVAEVVYIPLETGLLRRARARGLRVSDGLAMLLHQGTGCFEKWFGVRPVVTPALRARVEEALRPAP